MFHRVCTDIKTLFCRTFQDLKRPNSRVFQDSKKRVSTDFPGYSPFTNMVV